MANNEQLTCGVPIVRVLARAVVGKEKELAKKLATTSIGVVKDRPGFSGYFAGQPAQAGGRDFVFITIWRDFLALKDVFGESWRESFLPPGYAEIIEAHSIEHYELTDRLLLGL